MKGRINMSAVPHEYVGANKTLTPFGLKTTYYASNQGLLFLGPYLIDEIVSCQYALVQSKVPVYGYASQYYDAAVEGKVLVNGQITINYIDSNYLSTAIVEHFSNKTSLKNIGEAKTIQEFYKNLDDDVMNEFADALYEYAKNDDIETMTSEMKKRITQYVVTNPSAASNVIGKLRDKYWGVKNREALSSIFLRNVSGHNLNANLQQSSKDNHSNYRSMRPDQLPPFDLTVVHGNANINPQIRVLREVEITNVQQGLDPSGEPQTETYSFFCKSVDF